MLLMYPRHGQLQLHDQRSSRGIALRDERRKSPCSGLAYATRARACSKAALQFARDVAVGCVSGLLRLLGFKEPAL